jgi:hypothetical protein
MLGCVWSDLASNILMTFSRKCLLQVHLNPGADISAITVRLLRWDFLRTLRRLSTRANGSTAAVPNIADPFVFEQQVSSTLGGFSVEQIPFGAKMPGLRV